MNRILRWSVHHPWIVIVVLVILTLGFGYQIKNLHVEPDITKSLPQHIPAKRLYDRMGELFPSKDFIMVVYEPDTLFSVHAICLLDSLTRELEALPELYTVISPTNVKVIRASDGGMEVKEALLHLPETQQDIAQFKQRLSSNPIFKRNLISRDERAAILMLLLHNDVDAKDFAARLLDELERFRAGRPVNLYAAGMPVVNHYASEGIARDMRVFFNAGILLMLALLLVIFRSWRGVFIPLIVVISSVVWTLGLMALVGSPMSHSTAMLPILLMAIGIADSIHVLTHYYQNARTATQPRQLAYDTIVELRNPVIMTSLTTMVGFLALNTSKIESLMQLGIFTAFGVLVAMIWSLLFVPAVLGLLKIKTRAGWRQKESPLSRRMSGYGQWLLDHKQGFSIAILIVVLLSLVGFFRIKVESSSIGNFPADHPLRKVTEYVNAHFAGTRTFEVIVEGDAPGAIKDPLVLAKMDSLERFAETLPHVGGAQSLADFVKLMNKVMHGDDPAYDRIPAEIETETGIFYEDVNGREQAVEREFQVPGKQLIAQYFQLYEMSGKPDEFAQFVDFDYQNAKISIFLNDDHASVLRRIDSALSGYIAQHFGDIRADITGLAKLMLVVRGMIIRGQALSILTSLLLVWFLTSLMFRSPVLGFYSILPLFFGMFLNFAIMGWFGILLNVETMITSSVAIGVGIDYAIHFIHRYRLNCQALNNPEQAVPQTMATTGVAILFNSITVALGFALMVFSVFRGVRYMGLLLALIMVTTAFGALTIVPVFFAKFRPKALQRGRS